MKVKEVRVLNIIGKRPTGGIGAVVYNYQSHFTDKNLKIDYMIFAEEKDGEFDKKVRALGSEVVVMPELRYSRILLLYKKINSFFKNNAYKYDIIHLHSANIGFLCYPLAQKHGIKNLIAHSHATKYSDKKINAIRNAILCLPLKALANVYFACSNSAAEFLYGKKFVESGQVTILNNAIDFDKFRYDENVRKEIRKSLKLDDKIVIGNVGRFNEQKNHEFIVDIFKKVKLKEPKAVLLLVGDGPLKNSIEEKVKILDLEDSVKFLGQRSDVNKLLQGMDIFLLPSLYEGLPVIGVEAQAAGLPCFMSDSITKEVNINNVQYLSLDRDSSFWAEYILDYFNKYNREANLDMIKESNFDIKRESIKLQEIYIDITCN